MEEGNRCFKVIFLIFCIKFRETIMITCKVTRPYFQYASNIIYFLHIVAEITKREGCVGK